MTFVVRSGGGTVLNDGTFTDVVDVVSRTPRQHFGWQSVTYRSKRYQLFGGIHTAYFINLSNPIRRTYAPACSRQRQSTDR